MIELTEQDIRDLRMAIEAAHVEGPISELRKIVVRYSILSKKLEDMLNESTANRPDQEHNDVASDSDVVHSGSEDGNVGRRDVRG